MTEPNPVRVLSCSEQDKYDLQKTIARQSRIIEKQEELIEHIKAWRPNTLDWHDKKCQLESELQALKDKKDVT